MKESNNIDDPGYAYNMMRSKNNKTDFHSVNQKLKQRYIGNN